MIRAIFFDIGDTLIHSPESDVAAEECHKAALRDHGFEVTEEQYSAALECAIASFAPNLWRAVNWQFTRPDAELCEAITQQTRRSLYAWAERNPLPPRPGMHELLQRLQGRFALCLAGNAPSSIRELLAAHGLLSYFSHTDVSEDIGYSKPDLRFFEHLLAGCGMPAGDAIMVGDRLDYDMIPAMALGLKTVWFRTGVTGRFEPRSHREVPDAEVNSVAELGEELDRLTAEGRGDAR